MASNRTYVIIGAFLIGVVILVVVGVMVFGGGQFFSQKRQAVIFFNQSVLGLSKGGRVLFRGVQIGTVKRVQLRVNPKANHARIAVTISMTGHAVKLNGKRIKGSLTIPQMVKRGLRAQLVVYSYVTSELAVNLNFKPDTPVRYAVPPDKLGLPEIPSTPSSVAKIKNQIMNLPWHKTMTRVNDTMKSMIKLSRDLDKTIQQLAPNLKKTADSSQKTLKTVRHAVQANSKQLQKTIKQVCQLTHNANQAVKTANGQLTARGQQLDRILTHVGKTTKQLDQLTQNLNSLVAPGRRSRREIKNILHDLSASAANLKDFTEKIERNPHVLIYGNSR